MHNEPETNKSEDDKAVLVDKYELIKKIGEGGSGVVYLAWDRHLECMVAVKEDKLMKAGKLTKGGSDIDFLKKEMEFLRSLKHPMLPGVIDYFAADGQYLVMEYIKGESLHNYIEKEGKIPEDTACGWALQLLDLLSYLHGQKPPVIYRDLKPENIMLCPDSQLRVVDFGSAFYMHYNGVLQENLAGTVGYAAPEQFDNSGKYSGMADERSDIYNFGATLYHMLTGFNPSRPPYGVRAPGLMNPELSADIGKIVLKCTETEPSKRYQSAGEVKRALLQRRINRRNGFFADWGKRRQCVIKKLEKNICLTDKKSVGLI